MKLIIPDVFNALLLEGVDAGDSNIAVSLAEADLLHNLLGDEDYTYLFITQGSRYEVVRGHRPSFGSSYIPVLRGQLGTGPIAAPVGSCVDARMTASIVNELMDQKIEEALPTTTPAPTTTTTTTTTSA